MKNINQLVMLAGLSGALAVQAQTNSAAPDQTSTTSSDNAAQAAARAVLLQGGNPAPVPVSTDATNAVTATPAPVNVSTDAHAASVTTIAANEPTAATPATNADPATAETAAPTTNAVAATTDTNATVTTVVTSATDTNAAVTTVATSTTDTNATVTTVVTTTSDTNAPMANAAIATAETAATTNTVAGAPAKSAGIPLIQFSDVPLTTAIENLARQAGINYMLDPKIAYGQPDASGQVKAEPTLSIRWENITAENALLALLDNYGLQLIHDPKTGISRITVKDPSAPPLLETRVVQLKYSSVSNMVSAVESTFTDKRSKVIADNRTSQMVIVATDPEQQAVDTLTDRLDTPTKQVLIETKLVDISSSPTSQKGIDWSGTLQAQHVAFGNTSQYIVPPTATTGGVINGIIGDPAVIATTARGFGSEGFLNADGLSAVLSFLNSSQDAQIVSTPRVVTLDNETATIQVTRGYPIFNVTASTANTTGGSSVTYTNVGTLLNVTPRISANDKIWLKVTPVVSSFAGVNSLTVGGNTYQADLFDIRTFDTQVLIPNAHTLVMGGLVQDNPISSSTKVPLLGDIPYLGYAFRSETKSVTKDNLLIFITPTIVTDDDFQAADNHFFETKPTKRPVMLDPNNLWDGTRPYNWSNPTNTDPAQALIDEPSTR